jgi:hypothetical protein
MPSKLRSRSTSASHWNETGHARLPCRRALEDARATVAARLAELGDDWPDHIAIL